MNEIDDTFLIGGDLPSRRRPQPTFTRQKT